MGIIKGRLIQKIESNIDKIGGDLREFPGVSHGDYLVNREKNIPIGHIFNWTQSFFTGMALWAYMDTKEEKFLSWAEQFQEEYHHKVFQTPLETMHDLGFLYSCYAVMLYSITGKEIYKDIAVKAADALAMRYDARGCYIRAWGRVDDVTPEYVDSELAKNHFFTQSKGLAIVDCMMNIPLLFWATEATGHPFYRKVAIAHADTTLKNFVREDYSVAHAYRFDEETGDVLREENYCGYGVGSHWARGTAWAVYGFAIAYRYTGKREYYDAAMGLMHKFMEECGGKIPVWDFRLPEDAEKALDTSAAAIMLCGMIELEAFGEKEKIGQYKEALRTSLEEYVNYDENVMGILREQDGVHVYSSYGDYFFIESMMKERHGLRIW